MSRPPAPLASARTLALFRMLFGACLALDVTGLMRDAPLWFDQAAMPVTGLLAVWLVVLLAEQDDKRVKMFVLQVNKRVIYSTHYHN